jgi:hypothetical protein
MAHDLIHIAVLHSSDSPTKVAFACMDIGVGQVTLGLGAGVSKLLNDCLELSVGSSISEPNFGVIHRCAGNLTTVDE